MAMKHQIILIDETGFYKDEYGHIDWGHRQMPNSILIPEDTGLPPSIKTETHDIHPQELLNAPMMDRVMQNDPGILGKIRKVCSYNELKDYINNNAHNTIITINFGIATHPSTDFTGHDLGDWIFRLSKHCEEHFKNLKWRFANNWDCYGHNFEKWINWFKESTALIDDSKMLISVANYEQAKEIRKYFMGADVRFNLVYFKRMVRESLRVSPDETFKIHKHQRSKVGICLNNFAKRHRDNIVDFLYVDCDPRKFYISHIHRGIKLQHPQDVSTGNIQNWQDTPPYEIMGDGYIYIATETFYQQYYRWHSGIVKENKMMPFITEKCLKSAYYYLPMLIVGQAGALQVWKDLGFKSFPEFFDESYDKEQNPDKRMDMLKVQIKRYAEMTPEGVHKLYHDPDVQAKLIHNKLKFNEYVRRDDLLQWTNLATLFKPGKDYVGLNPHLDEIFLDK